MNKVKKQEIVNTAIDLFAERGISSTFIEDIAGALGASKGRIYHYFKNGKKDIIAEILLIFEACVKNSIPDVKEWESEDSDAERILFNLFFKFPDEDALRYRKIVHIILSGMHEDEQLKEYAVEVFIKGREELLTDCISSLNKNGKIKSLPLNPQSAARFFNRYILVCAMLDSSRYPYVDDKEKADMLQAEVVRDCTDFIHLLLGKKNTSEAPA